MKNLLTFLLLSFCFLPKISAQQQALESFGNKFNFEYDIRGLPGSSDMTVVIVPDTALYKALGYLSKGVPMMRPKSPILLGVKLSPATPDAGYYPVRSISKLYSAYLISDSSEAIIVAMGINNKNVDEYQYRVVEDDSLEIIPWSKIPGLQKSYGAKQPYGFLGKFKAPGKQLLVEVRSIKNYGIRDGIIFDWHVNLVPKIREISVIGRKDKKRFWVYLQNDDKNMGLATKFDPDTHIPLDFKFPLGRVTNIQLLFEDHQMIPFDISITKVMKDTSIIVYNEYALTDNFKDILLYDFASPGKFVISVNRRSSTGIVSEKNILKIPFEITTRTFADQNVSMEIILSLSLLFISVIGVIILIFYRKTQRRLQKSKQEQQVAALKLKSIRSQLNPHFMFNALTSIQNLINKNNISDANFYLSKFARLTRQVLDSNNENLVSLEDEVRILTDYLEMEQLRFDFQYEVQVDPSLNLANIEVPAMLLQPFVENAVKHGVSGLKGGGMVKIIIKGIGTDLEMKVQDNGAGYTQDIASPGYGIKLSQERVELLNQLYKDQPISLVINSSASGTVITTRLSNWIS
jgi:two-component system LytT family sensor kinase